jgi:colanic acid biosynthesis glycosyl transferase WcaI
MKILLMNQCFYPDRVSSAQHLTDLALELSRAGHEVTVLAGKRGYDDPSLRFPSREIWRGISIIRVPTTGMGKRARISRAIDFGIFLLCCFARLIVLPKVDIVVALTSPPLISFIAALFAQLKRAKFYNWILDLNPDEAIAAGWLRKDSSVARMLAALLLYSTKKAQKLIVLDRFMKERLKNKGIAEEKIIIVPPWSHDRHVFYNSKGRESFRTAQGLTDKFVVMYSGNHSPCHPLTTLLQAARQLAHRSDIQFLFIGGGSEFSKAKEFAEQQAMINVRFLPYQPLDRLADTLSSADLHVAVMGNPFIGIVHPCKIYNILHIGAQFLYIGPEKSHIEDIIRKLGTPYGAYSARHGEVSPVVDKILEAQSKNVLGGWDSLRELGKGYSETNLLPKMIEALECAPAPKIHTKPEVAWDYMIGNSSVIR